MVGRRSVKMRRRAATIAAKPFADAQLEAHRYCAQGRSARCARHYEGAAGVAHHGQGARVCTTARAGGICAVVSSTSHASRRRSGIR